MIRTFVVMMLGLLYLHPATAKQIPLDLFVKDPEFTNIKLSPKGNYLAATVPVESKTLLVTLDLKTLKPIYAYDFGENQHVLNFHWATNKRLVLTRGVRTGDRETRTTAGELFAGNVDGSKKRILFSAQKKKGTTRSARKDSGGNYAIAQIIGLLRADPDNILISARSYSTRSADSGYKIQKINIHSGRLTNVSRKTPLGRFDAVFNYYGEPLFGSGLNRKGENEFYEFVDGRWKQLDTNKFENFNARLVNRKGDIIYGTRSIDGGPYGAWAYNLKSKQFTRLFQDDTHDVLNMLTNPKTLEVEAVTTFSDKLHTHYINADGTTAKLLKMLTDAFKGHNIGIQSYSEDFNKMIVRASNERNPGDFYLFDAKTKKAEYIASVMKWLDPKLLAKSEYVHFNNRYGQKIHAVFTRPNNSQNKEAKPSYPLVVFVHGGPYGVRDYVRYDPDIQVLANNGYAVLQVNYRGSGGYGLGFQESTYRKSATEIQYDIIDGTKWALAQKDIDDKKVCIAGWSFGGFSAVMAPIVDTQLYKCAVAAAGVYDRVLQEETADYARVSSIASLSARMRGTDEETLRKNSPLTYIEKFDTPVLIIHGGKDARVVPEHAHRLRKALEKYNKPYEWLFKKKEGHGFVKSENKKEYYSRMLSFLAKYLKTNTES